MKFWIPFAALGLLTLSCAASLADNIVVGGCSITANKPAATYLTASGSTVTVPGQSSHTVFYENLGTAPYPLNVAWTLSLNLGGVKATDVQGLVGILVPAGKDNTWNIDPNPTLLNVQGNFGPGAYKVAADTKLDATLNGLILKPGHDDRDFDVIGVSVVDPVGVIDDPIEGGGVATPIP